ncbi:MAG: hypothetical protein V4491_07125 [Pseudomonadota bacterium]
MPRYRFIAARREGFFITRSREDRREVAAAVVASHCLRAFAPSRESTFLCALRIPMFERQGY